MDQVIAKYNTELDAAVIAFIAKDEREPFAIFVRKYQIQHLPSNPIAYECAVMKIATSRCSLPMSLRTKAKRWLIERGFDSWDDGDVPLNDNHS